MGRCGECAFRSTTGQCYRFPPTPVYIPQGLANRTVPIRPTVGPFDTCGEFKRKEAK